MLLARNPMTSASRWRWAPRPRSMAETEPSSESTRSRRRTSGPLRTPPTCLIRCYGSIVRKALVRRTGRGHTFSNHLLQDLMAEGQVGNATFEPRILLTHLLHLTQAMLACQTFAIGPQGSV